MWSHSEIPIKAISENRGGQQGRYLEVMRKEFEYALEVEMPNVPGKAALYDQFSCFHSLANNNQTGQRSTFNL